jgi:hypothetical protein
MSIYRNSCRTTERVTMKKLFANGFSVKEISTKLRVQEHIITDVVEGKWDSKEKAMTLAAMERNKEALIGKADAESTKIAQIAAAAAAAIQGQTLVADPAAMRAKIEAEIRAEIAAEVPVLTQGQKAAATRAKNKAIAADAATAELEKTFEQDESQVA